MQVMPVPPQLQPAYGRVPLCKAATPYTLVWGRANITPESAAAMTQPKTSVVIQNLPDGFTRSRLMDVMRANGLAASIDFMYAPGHLKAQKTVGYAFVNFTTPESAEECLEKFDGFIVWGERQGLNSHIEKYRNSSIMHESVDDEFQPAVFKNGSRIPFPAPCMHDGWQ